MRFTPSEKRKDVAFYSDGVSSDSRFISVSQALLGIITMSLGRSRPETSAAEFVRVRSWLGLPRAFRAQLHGKYVRRKDFSIIRASWWGDCFESTCPLFLGREMKKRINAKSIHCLPVKFDSIN